MNGEPQTPDGAHDDLPVVKTWANGGYSGTIDDEIRKLTPTQRQNLPGWLR